MNESSIVHSIAPKYLTFLLSRYFLWRIKINNRPFLGCLSTKLMTILLKQTHFETNIFLSTKVIREREKRGFTSYLSALGGDRRLCLKIMPSRENEIYLWKMVFKVGMYSAQPSPTCKCFKLELQDDPLKEVCCWIQIWLNENN